MIQNDSLTANAGSSHLQPGVQNTARYVACADPFDLVI